ncbi:MAG TPA: trehalose-phosphatase [Candidatus Sulfotelmatobacter sp.]|nr:trehalose-phosphatase [Candidatus Sulfotelmatobacter sp.]
MSGGDRLPISELPDALDQIAELEERLSRRRPAFFLDYDGTLTPIVERPENAVIAESMRNAVRKLADMVPVCIVSGRDRRVVQLLMGIDDLIVAGSHGFDIWSPDGGTALHEEGSRHRGLMDRVESQLRDELAAIPGALVEPKSSSVAAHYRLVPENERGRVQEVVQDLLAAHPDDLKVTPGRMVYEIQPKIDWDKGKAVLYLLDALDLNGPDVVPVYLGDDLTDEDAFAALKGRGIGVFVGSSDPEQAGRETAAQYALCDVEDAQEFLLKMLKVLSSRLSPRGGSAPGSP